MLTGSPRLTPARTIRVADGLCCESCGGYIGSTPGHSQFCDGCKPKEPNAKTRAAMRAGQRGKVKRFDTVDEVIADARPKRKAR